MGKDMGKDNAVLVKDVLSAIDSARETLEYVRKHQNEGISLSSLRYSAQNITGNLSRIRASFAVLDPTGQKTSEEVRADLKQVFYNAHLCSAQNLYGEILNAPNRITAINVVEQKIADVREHLLFMQAYGGKKEDWAALDKIEPDSNSVRQNIENALERTKTAARSLLERRSQSLRFFL